MKSTLPQAHINTSQKVKNDGVPRLPNERDESPDDQNNPPRPEILQAYDDLQHGMVDTDCHGMRGVEKVVEKVAEKPLETINKAPKMEQNPKK